MRLLTLLGLLVAAILAGCVDLRSASWARSPRTGDAALDEILAAIARRDVPRIAALVGSVDVPCVDAEEVRAGRGGTLPACPEGTVVGTAVPSVWLSGSARGGLWVRLDAAAPEPSSAGISPLQVAQDVADDRSWIVAVVESSGRASRAPGELGVSDRAGFETFGTADFTVFVAQSAAPGFLAPSGGDGAAVLVQRGRIVGVEYSNYPGGDLPLVVERAAEQGRLVLPPSR